MTCYKLECPHWWKIYLYVYKKNPLQDLLSSLNAVISTNERNWILTGHVIFKLRYNQIYQLKTTLDIFGNIGYFWKYWIFLDISGHFQTLLDFSGHFWTFVGHLLDFCWTYLILLGYFWNFLHIFRNFWTYLDNTFGHFLTFLNVLDPSFP